MPRGKKGRVINGVILIDKHQGDSSNRVLQQVKRLFFAQKAGHTGALDPLATGMLPVCLGEATKFSRFLLDTDKTYEVTAKLGVRTTTSDADGEVVSNREVAVDLDQLTTVINSFKGTTQQIPSMYSALKYEGQPLYKYARQGIEVPRESRDITVYSIELLDFSGDEVQLRIHCSKGTYIRTIVDDMGEKLGCGAHVQQLRRIGVGHYPKDKMITVAQLSQRLADLDNDHQGLDSLLLAMDTPAATLPMVALSAADSQTFSRGNFVLGCDEAMANYRVYDPEQRFLGVGEVDDQQRLLPKRVVNYV